MLTDLSPEEASRIFDETAKRDQAKLNYPDFLTRWLFVELLTARGARKEMSFDAFVGPQHIQRYFSWIMRTDFGTYFEEEQLAPLIQASIQNDRKVAEKYDLKIPADGMKNVALYNAQDYLLQRSYYVPARNKIRIMLDFGAGHGRMSNLNVASAPDIPAVEGYIAVDGISASYLTQASYFKALGLKVWEYFDQHQDDLDSINMAEIVETHDVVHLPTWRMDLIPDGLVNFVNCVQVLKELPAELTAYAIREFGRVSADSGAFYVRDHPMYHNPNHMPVDHLAEASGFRLEFHPQVIDRKEVHGVPRIYRKLDPSIYTCQKEIISGKNVS